MVINFIVPEISRTGGMRIIFEYANRISNIGHDVKLYTPVIPFYPYKGRLKRHFIKYQIKHAKECVRRRFLPPANAFEHIFDIQYLWTFNNMTVRDADATVATSWTSSYPLSRLNAEKGRKIYLIQDYEIWNSSEEYVDRSYTFPATRVTVSTYLRDLILRKFNSDSTVILNGIDFNRFFNNSKKFGWPPRILFIDHPLENKNTEGAIDAAKKIREMYPDAMFTCFGTGRYHVLPEFVEFIQSPDDKCITELYNSSDIFLYTSKYEGFGLPPAEAMACKCAVVGTNAGAVPEFAENMRSAIICKPDNTDEIVDGVRYLLDNPEELKRISFEGEKSVRQKLNWEHSVKQFLSLLK